MKKTINYKKVVITVLLVFLFITILGYIRINHKYPQAKIIQYQTGEAGSFSNGIEMTVTGYQWMSQSEFESIYGNFEVTIDNSEFKMLLVSVTFHNIDNQEHFVEAYQSYIECLGYNNGLGQEGYYTFNKQDIGFSLAPEAEADVVLPYVLYDFQFNKKEWKKIEQKEFYLVNSWYPIKKCWSI